MEESSNHATSNPSGNLNEVNMNAEYPATIQDMPPAHPLSDEGTMVEQAISIDNDKNPCQQESAYGSLESSSQGQSQKSSYSGSKSLNSGSSHSSGFGDNADYRKFPDILGISTTYGTLCFYGSALANRPAESHFHLSVDGLQPKNPLSISIENRYINNGAQKRALPSEEHLLPADKAHKDHKDHKRKKSKEKIERLLIKDKSSRFGEENGEKELPKPEEVGPRLTAEPVPIATPVVEENIGAKEYNICDNEENQVPIYDQPSLVYTQALHYIRKIKERSAEQGVPLTSPQLQKIPKDTKDVSNFLKSFAASQQRGFSAAISIHDGTVLHVSPSITDVLGFPKDMLIGQSFIDFVYPRDSINLSSKIIHGMNSSFATEAVKDISGTSFFCRLRMYHGLMNSGFGVRNKRTVYKPCKMTLKLYDKSNGQPSTSDNSNTNLLLANVIPIESAYTRPCEAPIVNKSSFSTRHTGGCNFSDYDSKAIPYLGHLPQDLTGQSVFDCYHPSDLPFLKTVYEEIVRNQGKLFKSKPYRFRAFNGSYVTLETEWLCFVNPWSKKIESIIGQHNVVKGPLDIDIFLDPGDKALSPLPEEVMKDAKKAQTGITELLEKPVAMYMDPSKEPQVVRRKTLANVMSSIVEELDSLEKKEIRTIEKKCTSLAGKGATQPPINKHQQSSSIVDKGQESVNSSCEAPSSYGQLNYSETMNRFFRSQPKTVLSDESTSSKMGVSQVDSADAKSMMQQKFSVSAGSRNCQESQSHSQSQSCSGSGDNYCDNNRQSDSTGNGSGSGETGTSSADHSYHPVLLTEEVLNKHNANMQKMFLHRHRMGGKLQKDKWKIKSMKRSIKKPCDRSQGVKRSCAVLGPEANVVNKQAFMSSAPGESSGKDIWNQRNTTTSGPGCGKHKQKQLFQPKRTIGLSIEANVSMGNRLSVPPFSSGIIPQYYVPTSSSSINTLPTMDNITIPQASGPTLLMQHQQPTFLQPQASMAMSVPYMGAYPGVMYQPIGPPIFNAPPLMLPNVVYQHTVVQPPLGQVSLPQQSDGEKPSGAESEQELDSGKRFGMKRPVVHLHRPDSQATSVKAEPGSARGSNASASGKLICTHSHAAESMRSYLEDTNHLSPGCVPKDNENSRDSSQVSQLSQCTSVRAEAESIGSPGKQEKMIIEDQDTRLDLSSDMVMSSSSDSPGEYKSTDDSSPLISENSTIPSSEISRNSLLEPRWRTPRSKCPPAPSKPDPPWIENVSLTPQLLYKYQLETKELVDVLKHDMNMLMQTKQSSWVDDQLTHLYSELELEGSPRLHLEEGITSSSGEDQAEPSNQDARPKIKKTSSYFSRMAMIHEEDAPIPSPNEWETVDRPHQVDSCNSSS